MEITLINTSNATLNMGMRYLSSYLKSKGHKVNLVFFYFEGMFENKSGQDVERTQKLFEQLLPVVKNSDLLGFSLMTSQFDSSAKLTRFLKEKTGKPVAWGGIHATLCPEECIQCADVVFLGDAEDSFLELVEKMERGADYGRIRGTWVKKNGVITRNEVREIVDDLDAYPPMDYSIEDKWIIRGDDLVPLDADIQKELFAQTHLSLEAGKPCYTYVTQASRGCPHRCAYCSNASFLDMFKGKGKTLRRRSIRSVINELKQIKAAYPYINSVNFYDDTFFAAPDDEIVAFAEAYKKEIGLPFFALASPPTLSEKKLAALFDAGLGHVQMGVQTGSERLNKEVYNRIIPNKLTLERMKLLNNYKDRIVPQYDFIIDNPYETDGDKLENLRFLAQIPKPFKIQLFSLVFYPHTALYERAIADGSYTEELGGKKKSLSKFTHLDSMDYYSFMVGFSPQIPHSIYTLLSSEIAFKLFNNKASAFFFRSLVKTALWLNKHFKLTKKIVVDRSVRRGN